MPLLPGAEPFSHEGGPVGALVLHGFSGQPASMRPWAEHLAEAGLSVELPRLPGHGTTWQDMTVTRWEDWYAEADRALTVLRRRCDTTFVMGLSMGGTLALRLAESRPDDVAGLVLVNPAVHTERWDRHLLPVVRHLVKAFPGITDDIKKPGVSENGYDKLPLQPAHSLQQLWALVRQDIAAVRAPLLLLHSRVDHVVEPSNAAWILAHVSSADTTEVWLEDSYHVATLDNDAPMIFERSVEFVHRLAPAPPQA
ncbi:MAG: alpha/beta fold hydrolase [Frankiales bacterium]|nr:alpha/beta fold hydrolase [Frankiales bacterium]